MENNILIPLLVLGLFILYYIFGRYLLWVGMVAMGVGWTINGVGGPIGPIVILMCIYFMYKKFTDKEFDEFTKSSNWRK